MLTTRAAQRRRPPHLGDATVGVTAPGRAVNCVPVASSRHPLVDSSSSAGDARTLRRRGLGDGTPLAMTHNGPGTTHSSVPASERDADGKQLQW
jgi:hypothetical protein